MSQMVGGEEERFRTQAARELLGYCESNLPLDSRFRGNDCLHRPAREINFPQMTPVPSPSIIYGHPPKIVVELCATSNKVTSDKRTTKDQVRAGK